MQTIERDYSPKGVQFLYVYKALAHPQFDNYVSPFTLQERLLHVKEAERRLGSRIPWLCDGIEDDFMQSLGGAPNPEFVINPEGAVVVRRAWSDPAALREDLEKLVGKVDPPTQVSELDMKTQPPPPTVAKGIVPRIERGQMFPISFKPDLTSEIPYYVKLRAEVDPQLQRNGKGKLYLGFFLDPLYKVHWNNEAPPASFELKVPDGVQASPVSAVSPKIEAKADADPREFLIDMEGVEAGASLELTFKYYACDDANTFCIPVTQDYDLTVERDRLAGSVIDRRRGRAGRAGRGRGGGQGPGMMNMAERLGRMEQNGDGRLSKDELPAQLQRRFETLDTNGDGFLDQEELEAMASRFGRRPRP